MSRLFSIVPQFFIPLNHALASASFLIFLNWYDTGNLDYSGWQWMVFGGLLFGAIVLLIELRLHEKYTLWSQSKFLLFIRQIVLSCIFLAGSFSLGYALGTMFEVDGSIRDFSVRQVVVMIPLMTVFYSPLMFSFGVCLGLMNGVLLVVSHIFRANDS